MLRIVLSGFLLALGPLAALAPAQHVSVGFGRGGVSLRIGSPPVVHCAPDTGHWVVRRERVWVDGCERVVHVPARYAWRQDACGRTVRVCVRPAYDRVVREPGRWEWQERRVFVPHAAPVFGRAPVSRGVPVSRHTPVVRGGSSRHGPSQWRRSGDDD